MRLKLAFIVLIPSMLACNKSENSGVYKHGRLEYKITYLNEDSGNFDPALLPKKMVLEFNPEFCSNTIDGFMGFFRLENHTFFKKKKSVTQLKVIDKRYVFYGGKHELMCCFDAFEDMIIEADTLTKIIAGLKSYHAVAKIPAINESFDIYYTYDIDLERPNITNPYLDIDGVLTDFVLYMGPYKMRFEAQKFNPDVIPDGILKIDEKMKEVTRAEMVYALERLMK